MRVSTRGGWYYTADRMSRDGRIFEEAYAALAAMQNPWRNATMHLDQKYTVEEARNVFDVVGGSMRKLASRMDEDGSPKA
jgi:bisphosphoglycerate-independent phosphoglycerate mutase (AlkP superfamily)